MNYEKKYKEALANARQEYTTTENVERKQWLEELFPELKEDEDERIRKDLLAFIKAPYVYDFIVHDRVDPWIAWLEKQGEPKQEWSDEDENYLQSAENACEYQYGKNTSTILWLKSIKDRMKGKEDKQWQEL